MKNSAKQTCSSLLDSFAIKGGNKKKDVLFSLSYGWKFADLQFADWLTKEICNLRINQKKFADLKKQLLGHLCKFTQGGAWGKLIHEKNLKSKISWHCPFKLSFAWTILYKVKTADSPCHSLPTGNYIPWIYLKGVWHEIFDFSFFH
jgi:hypothetical protein